MEIDSSKYRWRKTKDGGWIGTLDFDEEDPVATAEAALTELNMKLAIAAACFRWYAAKSAFDESFKTTNNKQRRKAK